MEGMSLEAILSAAGPAGLVAYLCLQLVKAERDKNEQLQSERNKDKSEWLASQQQREERYLETIRLLTTAIQSTANIAQRLEDAAGDAGKQH